MNEQEAGRRRPRDFSDDVNVQYFRELWRKQGEELSFENRDAIGFAYLANIIGPDGETARDFITGCNNAYHEVGLKQAGTNERKNDNEAFWNDVRDITPEAYTEEEIEWLIEVGKNGAPFDYLFQLEWFGLGGGHVISKILTNAHAYK